MGMAAALELGPRPSIDADLNVEVATADVVRLLDPTDPQGGADQLAREVGGLWPRVRESLVAGRWRCWFLDVHVVAEDPPRSRGGVCVLDTDAGVLGADLGERRATLVPLVTADVWSRLAELLGPAA